MSEDPLLDFLSVSFDPATALHAPPELVCLPHPTVQPCDNLQAYTSGIAACTLSLTAALTSLITMQCVQWFKGRGKSHAPSLSLTHPQDRPYHKEEWLAHKKEGLGEWLAHEEEELGEWLAHKEEGQLLESLKKWLKLSLTSWKVCFPYVA